MPVVVGAIAVGETGDTASMITGANGENVAQQYINDGTMLTLDPNDPQVAALLRQAGFILKDVTVHSIGGTENNALDNHSTNGLPHELCLSSPKEGESVETNSSDNSNIQRQESLSLPTAPCPNLRQKYIVEESLVR